MLFFLLELIIKSKIKVFFALSEISFFVFFSKSQNFKIIISDETQEKNKFIIPSIIYIIKLSFSSHKKEMEVDKFSLTH